MSSSQSPRAGIVLSSSAQQAVVVELATALEQHLAGKRGISGMAMKLGFNTLRAARPDVAQRAVRSLLPEVLSVIAPLHADYQGREDGDIRRFLAAHSRECGAQILARLDARLAASSNTTARGLYQRFRSSAGDELQALLPTLGTVLARHMG